MTTFGFDITGSPWQRLGRSAGDPFAQRNIIQIHLLVVAHTETVAQDLLFGVDEKNAERIVIDQGSNRSRDLAE